MRKVYKVGDVKKWRGIRNSDTGEVDCGYLYIITEVRENSHKATGYKIEGVKTRKEAIKKYVIRIVSR